jgi:hypothetical protein
MNKLLGSLPRFRPCTAYATLSVFVVALAMVHFGPSFTDSLNNGADDFESGRVADRDVVASGRWSTWTKRRRGHAPGSQERLVPASSALPGR